MSWKILLPSRFVVTTHQQHQEYEMEIFLIRHRNLIWFRGRNISRRVEREFKFVWNKGGNVTAMRSEHKRNFHYIILAWNKQAAFLWAFFIISLSLVYDSHKKLSWSSLEPFGRGWKAFVNFLRTQSDNGTSPTIHMKTILIMIFIYASVFLFVPRAVCKIGGGERILRVGAGFREENRCLAIIHFNYEVTRIIIKRTLPWYFAPFRRLFDSSFIDVLLSIRIFPSQSSDIGYQRQNSPMRRLKCWIFCLEQCARGWIGGDGVVCTHFYVSILLMHLLLEYIIESYISVIFAEDCASF